MFEAQAWMKGKSKGKTKGHTKDGPGHGSVNAYASDLFLGGLEVSEAMEITATGVQTASPSVACPRDRISGLGMGVGDELCAEYICVVMCLDNRNNFHCMCFPAPMPTTTITWIGRPLCQLSSEWTTWLGPPLRTYRQPTAPPHPGARAVGN